jgi:hypothetical protein
MEILTDDNRKEWTGEEAKWLGLFCVNMELKEEAKVLDGVDESVQDNG